MRELIAEIEAEAAGMLSITDVVLEQVTHDNPDIDISEVRREVEAWRAGQLHVLPVALQRLADELDRAAECPRQMVML